MRFGRTDEMSGEFWARLEDDAGRVVGPDVAWKPQRQFLWDVVHDTRGLLRETLAPADLDLVRTIDHAPGSADRRFALDPGSLLRVYSSIAEHATAFDATFRLVAPEGSDAWAAVAFFEDQGNEYALVGGWTGPVLRTIAPEPDLQPLPSDRSVVEVGAKRFHVRSVPYHEYFGPDLASLVALLRDAQARRLRVRFLQR